ncbi:His-Xaa-Ser system radical SAM maturase HxsC [Microvirga massiliensis]|uniref:His-Xaa-Ser system radical SAM maturase HxsC n=1 Tax=Microvirga massiliensis TaxID=1033741 RepID=UPI00062BCDDE|nr:His-Xaa-Ser system radical SAM maturase HxsC [Microvirga massiliensis]
MAPPLHTRGSTDGITSPRLFKVLRLEEALGSHVPLDRVMVDLRSRSDVDRDALQGIGVPVILEEGNSDVSPLPRLHSLSNPAVVGAGDAIRVHPSGQVNVLYRRGANANTLFATEACNSRCLMCSQPPRDEDASWRVAEMLELLPLIDPTVPALGITGGEPTLLGEGLRLVLEAASALLPDTTFHVLTNGRTFASAPLVDSFDSVTGRALWAIPLYADNARDHDHIVQAGGAFAETIDGLYNLAERSHRIEVRFVLHRLTVGRLERFAEFIYRNMPFVEHVAFMGLEPMGYARMNRDLLWIDPLDYAPALGEAVRRLSQRRMRASIYNVQLCLLDGRSRPFARQSISDWKSASAPECANCAAIDSCCGFFRSAGPQWRSRGIQPLP